MSKYNSFRFRQMSLPAGTDGASDQPFSSLCSVGNVKPGRKKIDKVHTDTALPAPDANKEEVGRVISDPKCPLPSHPKSAAAKRDTCGPT